MSKFIDLTGQKFGRLTIVERIENAKDGHAKWLCQCKCNNNTVVYSTNLIRGLTRSCGCLNKELTIKRNYKHGHSYKNKISNTYIIWQGIIQRCNDSNHGAYKNYGGRGIKVCDRWQQPKGQGFINFLKEMGKNPGGLSIDRINNNGDYCKENCRWSTIKEQIRNRRNTIWITIDGITKCLAEWCEIYHIDYKKVWGRIYQYGWTPEEALELILRRKNVS